MVAPGRGARGGARRAARRSRRCPRGREARAARSSGRGRGRPRAAGAWTTRSNRSPGRTRAGRSEPDRIHVRSRRADLLDRLHEDVERLLAVGPAPHPVHPVVHHQAARRRRRRAASCPPRQRRLPVSAAWPDDIQGLVNDPPRHPSDPGPPEYNVYRSRRRAPAEARRGGGDLDALRKRLSRFRDREPREPGERRGHHRGSGAQVDRARRWSAGCSCRSCCSSSAPRPRRACPTARSVRCRATAACCPAARSSCSAPTPARATRSTSPSRDPREPTRSCSSAAAFGSVRKLSIPRDSFAEIPGHGAQKINAAYALGGPRADDPDGRGLHGQRRAGEPPDRGRLRRLPEADRRARGHRRDRWSSASARRRSTTSGRASASRRASSISTASGRSASPGSGRTTARRTRPTSSAPSASSRCSPRSRAASVSPGTFFRLPLVSWRAPQGAQDRHEGAAAARAVRATSPPASSDETKVLEPSCLSCGPGGSLVVSAGAKRDGANNLVDGD